MARRSGKDSSSGETGEAADRGPLDESALHPASDPLAGRGGIAGTAKRFLIGRPRDPNDPSVFRKISLMAFLAWVGLGADGL